MKENQLASSAEKEKKISRPLTTAAVVLSVLLTVFLLAGMLTSVGRPEENANSGTVRVGLMDKFDMAMTNYLSSALEGVVTIDKLYWLSDDDPVAPEPNQACYGQTDDPSTLQWLLDEAAELLDGQELIFSTETVIKPGSVVRYYLDETIFAVTWKQAMDTSVYTFSEVKIAHASQFRRFFAGGEYGSGVLYTTTEMAAGVNAIVASSGDYYSYRRSGLVVSDGVVQRYGEDELDTCFIDDNGDLNFIRQKEFAGKDATQQYVDENNIRFSLSFGPVLIEDGEVVVPLNYPVGEINKHFSRAALCQQGPLHYAIVMVNMEPYHTKTPSLSKFASRLQEMGIQRAYTLDGGQTATLVMNDEMINDVDYGNQRDISDIIYFATAVPSGSSKEEVSQ